MTRATSIPMHVIVLGDMQKIINAQRELIDDFRISLQKELDTRLVGNDSFFFKNEIKEILTSFHDQFSKKYLV